MIERKHVEALRRLVKTTREGCERTLRFPPAASEHRDKLEAARRALVDDCALVEELAAEIDEQIAQRPTAFNVYPMLDTHDGLVSLNHRAVFTFREKATHCAVDPRSRMTRWLGSPDPVHSVCEVELVMGQERVTRQSLYTLTGIQLSDLYEHGMLKIGSATIQLVNDWPVES